MYNYTIFPHLRQHKVGFTIIARPSLWLNKDGSAPVNNGLETTLHQSKFHNYLKSPQCFGNSKNSSVFFYNTLVVAGKLLQDGKTSCGLFGIQYFVRQSLCIQCINNDLDTPRTIGFTRSKCHLSGWSIFICMRLDRLITHTLTNYGQSYNLQPLHNFLFTSTGYSYNHSTTSCSQGPLTSYNHSTTSCSQGPLTSYNHFTTSCSQGPLTSYKHSTTPCSQGHSAYIAYNSQIYILPGLQLQLSPKGEALLHHFSVE